MLNSKNKIIITSLFGSLSFALKAQAICPVCVIAVSAGLGLSEYLGIDDTIAGVWIGGLLVSLIIWTINWFNKKNWPAIVNDAGQNRSLNNRDLRDVAIVILYYALTFWPLWIKNFIGSPANRLFGLDKLILGTVLGSLVFLAMTLWYNSIKKRRGHAHFPYEKVVMPLSALFILSLVFYLIVR